MATTEHVNASALRTIVELVGTPRTHVAAAAQVDAGEFSRLLSGQRQGTKTEVRTRIAVELGVPVEAITCWCDRPDGVCRTKGTL